MAYVNIRSKKRIFVIFVFCLFLFTLLLGRLVYVQIIRSSEYKQEAYSQHTRKRSVVAKRGTIYDATGENILAQSISKSKVTITPTAIENKEEVGQKLAEILELDIDEVMQKLNKNSAIETLYSKIDEDKETILLKYIAENDLDGINVDEDTLRVYPYNTLLSQTLGFVGSDNQGLAGIEIEYEKTLKGINGSIVGSTDTKGNQTPFTNEQYIAPENGKDLILTIDVTIQSIVEKYLDKVLEENIAKYATAVVLRPSTGEVLAMCTVPTFNLNEPFTPVNEETKNNWDAMSVAEKNTYLQDMWRNRVISDTAEPGSSFKIVTAAAILEEGIVELDDPDEFYCNGYEEVGGWTIKCWRYPRTHGSESLRDGIMNSCNPVFIQGSRAVGLEAYIKYLQAFNLYGKTGIDLPGEATGILHNPETMTEVDLATTSFGQTIQISTIQAAVNYAAIANGGYLVKPYVVKEIRNQDGSFSEKTDSEVIKQILSKSTADDVLSALETTVSEGTGKAARVNGYRVAGKTATAEIGRGEGSTYMAGFAGIAPVNNPEIVVILNVMDPKGPLGHQGSTVAAPVVGSIIDETLRYLDVAPEFVIEDNDITEKIIPDLINKTVLEAKTILSEKGFNIAADYDLNDTDVIKDQIPKNGASLMEGSTVRVYINDDPKETVTLPDLRNKSENEVKKIINNLGLNLRIVGKGYTLIQEPTNDTVLEKGSIVTIKCVESLDLP